MQSISRLILLILLFPLFLSSHQRSESYSNWNIEIQDEVLSIKTVFSVRESVLLNLNLDDISTLENYLINSISFSDCELNVADNNEGVLTGSVVSFTGLHNVFCPQYKFVVSVPSLCIVIIA